MMTAVFFIFVITLTSTFAMTIVRMRRRRRTVRIMPMISPQLRAQAASARAAPMDGVDIDARHAWLAAEAAATGVTGVGTLTEEQRAMLRAREEIFLAAQRRIVELQQADEERALAHAVEASLSTSPSGPPQRSQEETVVQQALEVCALPARARSLAVPSCSHSRSPREPSGNCRRR